MQKINDLFGKRVISQQTGDQLATVKDVVLDRQAHRILALIIGGKASDEQVVRRERIMGMGEFIIVDGAGPFPSSEVDAEIAELRAEAQQITGKKIISTGGEQIGTVGDMYFSRSGAIVGFELKHGLFSGSDPQVIKAAEVQAVGKDAVIVTATEPVSLSILTEDEIETPAPGVAARPSDPAPERDDDAALPGEIEPPAPGVVARLSDPAPERDDDAALPGEKAARPLPPIRPVEP
jgi:uncharacterized protein YrrD